MKLEQITSQLLYSVTTANTIDDLECAQHIAGFRSCIESFCLEVSRYTDTEGNINNEGVHCIENLYTRILSILNRDEEGLVPFIDGIKDATLCIRKITEDRKNEVDYHSNAI